MAAPIIHDHLLPYVDRLARRDAGALDSVVIHCTELPDLAMARAYGEKVLYPSGTGNSGHYYIDRDGRIERYVPDERVAHHVRGHNERAIGIELVNRGRYPDWLSVAAQRRQELYPAAQVDALLALLEWLRQRHPGLRYLSGHEALDREQVPASDDPSRQVPRKRDPGPGFPWPRVLAGAPWRPLPGAAG